MSISIESIGFMICLGYQKLVGLGGLEPPTSPLSGLLYTSWGAVG
ncbi:hypothetical protein N9J70_01645 [Gammaproteobacteria bacterium]|nr:hypothetical protein [Gammaproteobacteria bacterium]